MNKNAGGPLSLSTHALTRNRQYNVLRHWDLQIHVTLLSSHVFRFSPWDLAAGRRILIFAMWAWQSQIAATTDCVKSKLSTTHTRIPTFNANLGCIYNTGRQSWKLDVASQGKNAPIFIQCRSWLLTLCYLTISFQGLNLSVQRRATGWTAAIRFLAEARVFLTLTYRPVRGLTQPPTQWVSGVPSLRVKRRGQELMNYTTPSLHNVLMA